MNMKKSLFRSAKLKIERADQHFRELVSLVNGFAKSHFYRMTLEGEAEIAGEKLTFEIKEELFNRVSLIVGDMVHNLRTALDHVACEVITQSGGNLTVFTKFPFGETREETIAAAQGVMQGVGLDVITSIVDLIQPYKGGNDALYTLYALDIRDKHRLLIPTLAMTWMTVVTKTGEEELAHRTFTIGEGGDKSGMVQTPLGTKIEGYRDPTLHILFDDIEGFQGRQGVMPRLSQMRDAVFAAVEETERAFLDSRKLSNL